MLAPRWSATRVLDTTGDGPDSPSLKGNAPGTTGAGRSRVYNDRRMADEETVACVGFDSPGGHWVASYRRDTMTELGDPLKTEAISEGLTVEKYEEFIRIVQVKQGEFVPDSVIIPNTQVELVAGAMEEFEATTVLRSD